MIPTPPPAIATLHGVDAGVARPGIPTTVTLGQAISIAVATSPSLSQARADAALAAVNVRFARAPLLPNISGSGSTVRVFASPSALGPRSETSNSASVDISQLIFDGGHVAAQIQSASKAQVSSVDLYRFSLMSLASNVADAYYDALSAHRTVELDRQLVAENEENEKLVRAQIKSGVEAGADLAQAQYQTAQALRNEVVAQGQELSALANLDLQIGLDSGTKIAPVKTDTVLVQSVLADTQLPDYDTAVSRALALRSDYDASLRTLESAQFSLRAAKRAAFPVLSGVGSYGTTSTNATGGAFRETGDVGLVLSAPLFDQGLTQAGVAQAEATVSYDRATLDATRLSISNGVKNALINVITARASVTASEYEVASAKASLDVARGRYRAGVSTLPSLVQANTSLTQAYTDETNSLKALREAEIALLYATGDTALTTLR